MASDGPKKTPTSGWSDAEDDQLRDFYVILQARANALNSRFSIEPAKVFYPGLAGKLLMDRLRRLATVHEEAAYLDALQDAWVPLWRSGRADGQLPDPHPDSLTNFELGKHRTYLCAKVNKQSM